MKIYQMVAKDVRRRRRRVLYAALGVMIGITTFTGILTVALGAQAKIYSELDKYGANLTVTPAISSLNMSIGDLSLGTLAVGENYIPEDRVQQIRAIANGEIERALGLEPGTGPATVAPRLYVNTQIKNTSLIVVGVDPFEERRLKGWWRIGRGQYMEGMDQVVVGSRTAELLGLNPGDEIRLATTRLRVSGVLGETGSNDDYQVFVSLPTLQDTFGKKGLVSSVDIRALCNGCPVEVIADGVNGAVPGVRAVAVKQIAENEMGLVDRVSKFLLVLATITLAVGGFGVVNTMMTSVHERIKDIGIMRSVGASGGQIVRVFMYEAVVIGLVGGTVGYLVGTLLAYAVGPLVFEGATSSYVPMYFPLSLGLATVIAVAASVYPALRATQIKVADSFRSL